MKTTHRKAERQFLLLAAILLFFQSHLCAQATAVYANAISGQDHATSAANAIDANFTTKAQVKANSGIAVGIGNYDGFIELQFPSLLPANTTSFVKIQTDDNLLTSLLGGSLGTLLSNVAGTALIGNQEFLVQAKNNTQVVLQGYSKVIADFSTSRLRIVVNANGEYFLCLTPSQAYDRIRLTNHLGALIGLNTTKNLDVYEAFYNGTPDPCGGASYTSYDGSGLTFDLLNLGGAGVQNPQNVIDANTANYSRLSLGILGVAASVEQTVYFDGLSAATDQFLLRLKIDPALIALGVANNIQVIASNGPNTVQTVYLNALLNVDLLGLLQNNQIVTIPFSPGAAANRITLRYNSLLNTSLSQGLEWHGVTRAPANPFITDAFTANNPQVCVGSAAVLIAQSVGGAQLNWYTAASGGTFLGTTNSGQTFNTGVLTQDTNFYVSAKKAGCPQESSRIKILVKAVSIPVAADIVVASSMTTCDGTVVVAPSSSKGSAFHYYRDQGKTSEIADGEQEGEQYIYHINQTTGALTVEGLTLEASPYRYYVSVAAAGVCENAANSLQEVMVTYADKTPLFVLGSYSGCGSVNLKGAIINFDGSGDINYTFMDPANNPISSQAAETITLSGTYSIRAVDTFGSCPSDIAQVAVTVNVIPTLTIDAPVIAVETGNFVAFSASSNAPITWYDSEGNALPSNVAGPFLTAGFYTFTAVASSGIDCSAFGGVNVTVTDPSGCEPLTQRMNATAQGNQTVLTGTVFNAENAVDGDPFTFSTISTGINVLGAGTTQQNLQWTESIAAGTPVTVKLGSQYSGLVLAGAYAIVGTMRDDSGVPIDIGPMQPLSGSVADLLAGQNTFEYTFVPADGNGPQDYNGIKIVVAGIAGISQNVKVYEAYYEQAVAEVACGADVLDVFYGATDLGVGVATATVGVADPYNSVDQDPDSYAVMYSGAGILAAADLTVVFRTPSIIGDRVALEISKPGTILSLNLLTGFQVQFYLGNTPVGGPIDNTSDLLTLTLLDGGAAAKLTIAAQQAAYDRIRIRFGGVASVLDFLKVHDIKRAADTSIFEADAENVSNVCPRDVLQLNAGDKDCTAYIWYDAPAGGNVVAMGSSYEIPTTLPAGTYHYYIQPYRYGCLAYTRGEVTANVCQTEDNTPRRGTNPEAELPCLIAYNKVTPNGDGLNDTFIFECLELCPDNRLEIYSKTGLLVYSREHYENDWDGNSTAKDSLQNDLYFYIFYTGVNRIVKRGILYLVR